MNKLLLSISRLLDYPSEALCQNREELATILGDASALPQALRVRLCASINRELQRDLYDLQARYDGLFDRGRSLSLYLFEHVHGDSRARGSAMVDLLQHYLDAGMQPDTKQLPDYVPLFLEFLATRDAETAQQWLHDASPVLQLLTERLRKHAAWEADLLEALLVLGGAALDDKHLRTQVAQEGDDSSFTALDQAWEDKEIRFDQSLFDETQTHCAPSSCAYFLDLFTTQRQNHASSEES